MLMDERHGESIIRTYLFHIDYMRSPGYQCNQYHRHNLVNDFARYKLEYGDMEAKKEMFREYKLLFFLARTRILCLFSHTRYA